MEKPDLYVLARILDRLASGRQYGKTDLQLASRINYSIFRRYLDWMLARGFVTLVAAADGSERVALTTKGLDAHARLVGWMRDALGDERL